MALRPAEHLLEEAWGAGAAVVLNPAMFSWHLRAEPERHALLGLAGSCLAPRQRRAVAG